MAGRPLLPVARRVDRCVSQAGLTLLEVLIAVAILGTTMVAVFQLHAGTVALATKAETSTIAIRLAKNRMVDLTKDGMPSLGVEEGEFEEPDDRFTWVERVEDTPYTTEKVKVYEITVQVSWGEGPNESIQVRTYRVS